MMDFLSLAISQPIEFIWNYVFPFVLVLSILVFVHEWGHYIVARKCGVRVKTFSIGFGKKIWSRFDKHGTEWQISILPLGGYVQMFGDQDPASIKNGTEYDDPDTGETRSMTQDEIGEAFFAKSLWKRSAIVFAGPAINFLFAFLILTLLYSFHGKPYTPALVTGLAESGAAERAGIEIGDEILAIDGKKIQRFEELQQAVMIYLDSPMLLTVKRSDKTLEVNVTPRVIHEKDKYGFKHSTGRLGIMGPVRSTEAEKHSIPVSFWLSIKETGNIIQGTFRAIGQMFTGQRSADELGGVVRIGAIAGDAFQAGFVSLVVFTALLSINLGLLNLFPIPMLDGGHLVFYLFEFLKGGPLSPKFQEYCMRVGLALVLSLMLFVTFNDLNQLVRHLLST